MIIAPLKIIKEPNVIFIMDHRNTALNYITEVEHLQLILFLDTLLLLSLFLLQQTELVVVEEITAIV